MVYTDLIQWFHRIGNETGMNVLSGILDQLLFMVDSTLPSYLPKALITLPSYLFNVSHCTTSIHTYYQTSITQQLTLSHATLS